MNRELGQWLRNCTGNNLCYFNVPAMLTHPSLFQLRDLKFSYSSQSSFSFREPVFKSMPNNEKLDRNNRYEVILFINSLQMLWNLYDTEECQKIEYLIKEKMPEEIERQLEVADWLVLNWNTFNLSEFAKAV